MRHKPHYGYYALPVVCSLSEAVIALGILTYLLISKLLGMLLTAFGAYTLAAYALSMLLLHQDRAAEFSDILELKGDELVLDAGCGLGKVAIGVAKNLKSGRVVGIDIWDRREIPGNSPEKAYENAEIEGVADRVEFRYGNVLAIPFPDETFDLVTCGSVLNNLSDEEKVKALREMHRVLKPGGRFLLIEPLRNLRGLFLFTPFGFWKLLSRREWEKLLKEQGFAVVDYHCCDGMGFFVCEKLSLIAPQKEARLL